MASKNQGFVFVPPTSDALLHRTGTLMVAVAASVSFVCSSVLLTWISYLVISMYRRQMRERISKFAFLRTQCWSSYFILEKLGYKLKMLLVSTVGVLFANLLVADFIQSIAFSMNYYWYFTHKRPQASMSRLCAAQGIGIQAGDMASAIWSFIIAMHTIAFIVWRWKPSNKIAACVVPFVWLIVIMMASIGPIHVAVLRSKGQNAPPFYNSAGLWCWIALDYEPWRVWAHYLFVFISAFGSLLMYTGIFLWLWFRLFQRGAYNHQLFQLRRAADGRLIPTSPIPIISQQDSDKFAFPAEKSAQNANTASGKIPQRVKDPHATDRNRKVDRAALLMLLFPSAYIISILPLATFRLARIQKVEWSYSLTVQGACGFMFALGGTFNAILYVATRKIFRKNKDSEFGSTAGPSQSQPGGAIEIDLNNAEQGGIDSQGPDGKTTVAFPTGVNVTNDFRFHTDLFVAAQSAVGDGRRPSRQSRESVSRAASPTRGRNSITSLGSFGVRRSSSLKSIGGTATAKRPMIHRKPSGLSQTVRFASGPHGTGKMKAGGTWDDGLSFQDSSDDEDEDDAAKEVRQTGLSLDERPEDREIQQQSMFLAYDLAKQEDGESQSPPNQTRAEKTEGVSPGTHNLEKDPMEL